MTSSSSPPILEALLATHPPGARTDFMVALATLLCARPYAAVTIDEVIGIPGRPVAEFHACFDSLETCFLDTHDACADLTISMVAGAVAVPAGTWQDRVVAGATAFLHALASQPQLSRALLIELPALSGEARRRRDIVLERFAELVRRLAEEHRDALPDHYAVHPEMAGAMIDGVKDLVLLTIRDDRAADLPKMTTLTARLVHSILAYGDPDAG